MFYPAAEYLADEIEKASAPDDVKAMHLDLGHVSEIDSGTADALKFTLSHVESLGVHVTVENANVSFMTLNDINLNLIFRRVSLDR